MFKDIVKYPLRGDDSLRQYLVGGLLYITSFLIIPGIILQGYLLNVLETSINGEDKPPKFNNFTDLFGDGLRALLISLGYFLPVFVIAGLVMFGGSYTDALASSSSVYVLYGLMIPIQFIYPAALAHFADGDGFSDAFSLDVLTETVLSIEYLKALTIPIALGVAAYILVIALAISVVGLVLVPFVYFYTMLAGIRAFGVAYRNLHKN